MGIAKWVHDGAVKFDVSGVTTEPGNMLKGVKAMNSNGEMITGTIGTETWELTMEDGSVITKEVTVL